MGDILQVRVVTGDGTNLSVAALPNASAHFQPGNSVTLGVSADQVIVLPEDSDQ